ncbi:MAG TPA: YncE family protein [Planctomycetota bacterium]
MTPQVDQSAGPGAPTTGNFFDNTKGNLVRHQLGHIRPIAIDDAYGDYLFAPNNAGQRLAMVYLPNNALVSEIPTGPGITALVSRPGTVEGWAVDSVNGCVSVIDPILNRIMRTIQVGKEPHGIAMLPDGSRAYVTCSGSNTVDVIACASYGVAKTIPIPARAPRGIAIANGKVWVAPLFSGNNTTAKKATAGGQFFAGSQQVVTPAAPDTPLPDQDLFAISITSSPTTDALDPSQTRTGLGTILLNLHARPGTNEVWIPNTDALNLTIGAANFANGQVVSNRITIVDTSSSTSAPTVLDLDTMVTGSGAAQPAAVAFDAVRKQAYVAAFGSDAIIVLDTSSAATPVYVNSYTLTPLTPAMPVAPNTPARCGPRGLVMSANGDELFVFNGIDNSFSRVDLTVPPPATVPTAHTLGFDPTPNAVKRGIGHLANASHSGSGTSSCMSCHVDGHFDMLTWNLSSFSDSHGTPNPTFERDNKGPMTTQSLRGLFEAGRLHWRGEQASLDDFNADGFEGLLQGSLLHDNEFAEVKAGTFSLVYPANPRQPEDRVYTGALANGQNHFRRTMSIFPDACASCHVLPLGSNTAIQPFAVSGDPSFSGKVPQLRGVGDKTGPSFVTVFGSAYATTNSHVVDRTVNGWGLTHAGTLASVAHFANEFPGLNPAPGTLPFPTAVLDTAAFLEAFDTGLAPATTFQRTLVPGVHAQSDFDATLLEIKTQARAGNCDIVVATAAQSGSAMVPVTFAWDHTLAAWQTGFFGAVWSDSVLRTFTFDAGLIVTIFGQPLGTGRRFGVDRDFDDLLDLDEANYPGSVPADVVNPDSDGDTLPDGYEARFYPSLHPRVFNSSWSSTTVPQLTSSVIVVYVTSDTAKLEFTTDQPAFAFLTGSGFEARTSPPNGGFDYNHSIHVRGLKEGVTTNVTLNVVTPSPNSGVNQQVVPITTLGAGDAARVVSFTVSWTASSPPVPQKIDVRIESFLNPTAALDGHNVEAFAYCEAPPGQPLQWITLSPNPVLTTQTASFPITIPGPVLGGTPGSRKLYFGVRSVIATGGVQPGLLLPYLEAHDIINFKEITF